jgi:hypothetical protein
MRTVSRPGQRALAMWGLASIALLAAACGTSSTPPPGSPGKTVTVTTPGPTHTITVTATPTPKLAGPPGQCSTSDLKLTIGRASAAAGTVFYSVKFTNRSSSVCTMYGFPGVAFVTKPGGGVIGAPAGRVTAERDLINLGPGGTAHATLAVSDVLLENNCRQDQVPVKWLQVYPPDQYAPLFAPFSPPNGHGCADKSLVVMYVGPVTWGATGP